MPLRRFLSLTALAAGCGIGLALLEMSGAWAWAAWWPHARNEFFVLAGSRNESGGWYGFHSGLGGAAYIAVIPALTLWYYQHTCHEKPTCLRWGAYEVAGGLGKKCRKHHPDLRGHPREHHGQVLDRLHREWQERTGG